METAPTVWDDKAIASAEHSAKNVPVRSLAHRIIRAILIAVAFTAVSITIAINLISSANTQNLAQESCAASMKFMSMQFRQLATDLISDGQIIVSNTSLQSALSNKTGKTTAKSTFQNLCSGMDSAVILFDKTGAVVQSTLANAPTNVSDLSLVQQAMQGTTASDIIVSDSYPFSVGTAIPMYQNDSLLGGVLLYRDLTDHVFLDELKSAMGQEFTIFQDNLRVSTTIVDESGNRQVNTTMSEEVRQCVLLQNQSFHDVIRILGAPYIAQYEPLTNSSGAVVGALFVGYELTDVNARNLTGVLMSAVMAILISAVAVLLINRYLTRGVKKPLAKIVAIVDEISRGEITEQTHTTLAGLTSKDEIGVLARSMERAASALQRLSDDTSCLADALSRKDLTITVDETVHRGIYRKVATVVSELFREIGTNMRTVQQSAEQILGSSEQVSNAAQSLAQGATEQASSIQELSATINNVSDTVAENASFAKTAAEASTNVQEQVNLSEEKMQELRVAMDKIAATSEQIRQIIKTIDDISFQTNILALNAAVEAARAGVAGKGFAVVADEVRNLAEKSAEAAQSTTELIENALQAVQVGTDVAKQAEQVLSTVVSQSAHVNELVDKIAYAAAEQASSLGEINTGIDQIASVVQSNSGVAEESAAASVELKTQAEYMNQMVEQYRFE